MGAGGEPLIRIERWWRLVDTRIGIIPLPLYPLILALLAALVARRALPPDLTVMIPLLALGGFTCAEVGHRLPGLRRLGAPAILATFLPSWLVYAHLLPTPVVEAVGAFTKSSNVLYLFVAAIVVGSILGMDRQTLVGGFLKILAPLAAGSLAAAGIGVGVGSLLGLGARHTLFFIVVPIMAGGIGEGALPLSLGYAGILRQSQGEVFAAVMPPVMIGSLTAILVAGGLNTLGRRFPHLTGRGMLQPGAQAQAAMPAPVLAAEPATIAAAGLTAVTLYLCGSLAQTLFGFPAPVLMLFAAVALTLLRAVSDPLRAGAAVLFRFFATAVTYPLLFAIGVAMTPWDRLVATLQPAILATIVATVATLIGTGFVVGRLVGLYPIDAAIVAACHSGQGGTGDVAILTAAERMQLMPFAQIATRIGGAITVTLALLALARLG